MRISDWSSDVCSSDLVPVGKRHVKRQTTCRSRRTACRIFVNTLLIAKDIYPGQRERRTLTAKAGEPSRDRRPSFRDAVSWTKTRSSGHLSCRRVPIFIRLAQHLKRKTTVWGKGVQQRGNLG